MKQGKIVKGIAGFYYVSVAGSGIYECKAKGAFRQKKMKPLVGDNVSIDIIDEEEKDRKRGRDPSAEKCAGSAGCCQMSIRHW
ncbi:MAG: hypothetical protein ACLUD0_09815 [Eubacterium ramulus]